MGPAVSKPLPLRGRHLEGALRDVVDDAVAGDVAQRRGLVDVLRLGPDHHPELDLPVELGRAPGLHYVVVGPADAGGGLEEHDRLGRNRKPRLLGMIGVVEPDRDELADADIRHAEARIAVHRRQRLRLDPREHLQAARRELSRADVLDDLRKVAQPALGVDHPRSFVARLAVTAQLHMVIPPSME
jgi:hypothetical protein